jgi:alpha-1,2-mannosyltransferase
MSSARKADPLFSALQYVISPLIAISYISAYIGLVILILTVIAITLIYLYLYVYFKVVSPRKGQQQDDKDLTIGFFHPYCDAGGGGERVLWCGIRAIQKRFPAAKIVVYTGDVDAAPDQILLRAKERFNLDLPNPKKLEFVYLHRRKWVEASTYPRFTLLGQSLGSIYLGLEAMEKCIPHVYLDTMGYAFTLPLFKYFGSCKVGCYVHYPTISTDMLDKVRTRSRGYNNRRGIASSSIATNLKLLYYKVSNYIF